MKPSWLDWNNAIGQATFSAQKADRVVYLAVDGEEIGQIGRAFDLEPGAAYESFRAALIAEVRHGWPDPSRPLREGRFPSYLGVLAAQVVAAFQMHDDGLTGAKAYWRRLREFLGQSSEDKRPDGLETWRHQELWQGLRRWANETNGGRLGRVQLAGKVRGHYLVAEPLGQCLLRRADLEKLRLLFAECGRPDPEPYHGRRLKELVDDARRSLPGRYFTKHSIRVIDERDRFDAAWDQIETEYERFLAEECPEVAHRMRSRTAGVQRRRPATAVLLHVGRKGLSGGLFRRGDGRLAPVLRDLGEVLWRCYLRAGRELAKPLHKPPHDDFILATRDDEFAAFVERSRCRAGDDVLLLVPEFSAQAWLDDADPRLFVNAASCYRPSLGDHRSGWAPLEGLPAGWLALKFKTREDLSDVDLDGKWIGVVNRRAATLRASGGLVLRRGVWMQGAGPILHVVGPGSFEHVLVDGEPLLLDASRRSTPELKAGEHRVRLPGTASRALRIRVAEPRRNANGDLVGWHRVECGWPASAAEPRRIQVVPGLGCLHGALLAGEWPAHGGAGAGPEVPTPCVPDGDFPDELAALILAVGLRLGRRSCPPNQRLLAAARAVAEQSPNPLLRGMLHSAHTAIRYRAGKV